MTFGMIRNYKDFLEALALAGFSMVGDNNEGIFSLANCFDSCIRWHTGDPNTDPWAFRMRVLKEERDIGYGKVFLQKGGYITREWAPYFLAVKRQHRTYEQVYQAGQMGYMEHGIMRFVEKQGEAAFNDIKAVVGDKGLEAALARLQTGMFLTISGEVRKLSKDNMPYGWPVTTFRLAEDFWGDGVMAKANALSPASARDMIIQRVHALNPAVTQKALDRFLR